jgi:arylsulfatase A-like enzyme
MKLLLAALILLPLYTTTATAQAPAAPRPNLVLILADDLGYGDVGVYGQTRIRTPNIDRLAAEGIRFTDAYAGSTVCSPSRSVLVTGQHTGHTRIRGNMATHGGIVGPRGNTTVRRMHLTEADRTIGDVLRDAGYRTAMIGKWHMDGFNPDAGPLDRGFDEFFGWLVSEPRTYAGNIYFPPYRFRNRELVAVPGNEAGGRAVYEPELSMEEAERFLRSGHDRPFFLFLSLDLPHSPYEAPDFGPYADSPWPHPMKHYAAMIHNTDRIVGRVLEVLREQGLDEETLVVFTSDNGPRSEPQPQQTEIIDFFESTGPLRGYKRDLSDGGIRVPMIARWPGRVPAGVTSALPWYFADILPTFADLAGAETPAAVDGVSVAPALLGLRQDLSDRFMYWEFHEGGFSQAVRRGRWKAFRGGLRGPIELYEIERDPGETTDIAASHPGVVAQIERYLATARADSYEFRIGERE